ncbi:MFS transporter [Micromonospora chaiyaphumensis]|uniref:MFS transporter n=1 Tax=Micromonospora chaiyaphumensis TaxID=307119 RepID=UPI000B88923E|nr:MFS transporter [Micromonospora chaiyaphumensis]
MLARYLVAAVTARLADEGARVAVVLVALERTGRAGLGGLLIAALMIPHVVAAPVAGAAADGVRHRKPLYALAFATYALALAGAAQLIGRFTAAAAALLIVAGCVAPLLLGGLSSLLSELAPGTLPRAFVLDSTTYGVAGIAGPAVAAVVAGAVGASWSLVVLGLCVLAGALAFLTLPLPARARDRRRSRTTAPLGGVTVLVRRRGLGAVTVASGLSQLGLGALPVAAASVALHTHRPALTGLVMSATAGGGLTGALLCLRLRVLHRHPERVLLICTGAMAAPLLLTAALPGKWPLLLLFALAGLIGSPVIVALFAVRDREAPPAVRTQVFTLGAGIKVTAAAAGAAVAGLATSHGPAPLLAAIAACQLAGAGAGALLLPAGRRPGAVGDG